MLVSQPATQLSRHLHGISTQAIPIFFHPAAEASWPGIRNGDMFHPLPRGPAWAAFLAFATQARGFWRLPCASPVVVERADPIMDPGKPSSHAHTVMGSNAFDFTMDFAKTQTATCSSCKVTQDHSSYWVPSLYYHAENGTFISVKQSGGALIYYL